MPRYESKGQEPPRPGARRFIELHTRPSCWLSVSALSITFACHAFCCNKSKSFAIAVGSRGTQSLFINVRLSAGLYDMLSLLRRADSNRRSPKLFCHAPASRAWLISKLQVCTIYPCFLRFQSSIPICHLIWLVEPVLKRAMDGTRTRVFEKVHTVIVMPYHSATIAFASAYLRRRQKPLYY